MRLAGLAFRNIQRNRRRSLLSGAAIGVAALAIVFMFALKEGMIEDIAGNVFKYVTGHLRIRHAEYDANEELNPLHLRIEDSSRLLAQLERRGEIAAAVPRIPFFTAFYRGERTVNGYGLGVDFRREAGVMDLDRMLQAGGYPEAGARQAVLSVGLAEELGLGVGGKVTLLTKNMYLGMSGMTLQVTGLVRLPVAGFNNRLFLLPLDTAQSLLKMGDSVTEILILLQDRGALEPEAAALNHLLAAGGRQDLAATAWTRLGSWYSLIRYTDAAYNLMALFFLVLGTTVIINTTMMVVYERMREIGTVSALGMTQGQIVRLFFLEAFFIGAIASLSGTLLGIGITVPLSLHGLDISKLSEGMSLEVSNVLYPRLNWKSTLLVFLYAVTVASLASLFPSLRATRIEPVEALRRV